MGHECGIFIAKAGRKFLARKGVKEGDQVLLEHYLPDMTCEWCHLGEYRHCEATDWHTNPDAIRYGYFGRDRAASLGQLRALSLRALERSLHKVPDNVTPGTGRHRRRSPTASSGRCMRRVSAMARWFSSGVGQQGLAQIVSCKQAGADCIIITNATRDEKRLEVASSGRRLHHRRAEGRPAGAHRNAATRRRASISRSIARRVPVRRRSSLASRLSSAKPASW